MAVLLCKILESRLVFKKTNVHGYNVLIFHSSSPGEVCSRVDSFDRRVTCEERKSLVFSGLFYSGRFNKILLGVFNKTIIPLALVGYEMIIANEARSAELAI